MNKDTYIVIKKDIEYSEKHHAMTSVEHEQLQPREIISQLHIFLETLL